MKTELTAMTLATALAALPFNSPAPEPDPDPQPTALAWCVVACVGVAVTAIIITAKRCEPKYYWLMDNERPPNFWVGTATKKECEIQEWTRIGGPYNGPEDAPYPHPDPTNRVDSVVSAPVSMIAVETSTNLVDWVTIHESANTDLDDFIYSPTNTGMFRIRIEP